MQATVLAGKVAHYALLAAIPTALHGFGAVWPAMATYIATQVWPKRSGVLALVRYRVTFGSWMTSGLAAG